MSANRPDPDNKNIQRAHFYAHTDISGLLQTKGQLIGTNDNGTGLGGCVRIAAPTTDFQALLSASDMDGGANWQTLGTLTLVGGTNVTINGVSTPFLYDPTVPSDVSLTIASAGGGGGGGSDTIQTAYDNSAIVSDVPVLTLNNIYRGFDIKNDSTPVTENYAMLFSVLPDAYTGSDTAALVHFAVQSDNVIGLNARVSTLTGGGNFIMGGVNDAVTSGDNNVLIGVNADAGSTSNRTVILGNTASASTDDTIAIGNAAVTSGLSGVSIGENAQATGLTTVAIGGSTTGNTIASGARGVAIGSQVTASSDAVGIGYLANANAFRAIAIGRSSNSNGGVAVGAFAGASDSTGVALGHFAAVATDGVAIGSGTSAVNSAQSNAFQSIAIGSGTAVNSSDTISIGGGTVNDFGSISIGHPTASINGIRNVYIGYNITPDASGCTDGVFIGSLIKANASAANFGNIFIGRESGFDNTTIGGSQNVVIGVNAELIESGSDNVIIGSGANVANASAGSCDANVAIGTMAIVGAGTGNDNSVAIGSCASAQVSSSVAIGHDAITSSNNSVAVGNSASVSTGSLSGIAIGDTAFCSDCPNGVAIGTSALCNASSDTFGDDSSVVIGNSALTSYGNAVAIGNGAIVGASVGIAIGSGAIANTDDIGFGGTVIGRDAVGFDGDGITIGNEAFSQPSTFPPAGNPPNGLICIGAGSRLVGDDCILLGKNSLQNFCFSCQTFGTICDIHLCNFAINYSSTSIIERRANGSIIFGGSHISQQIPNTTIAPIPFMCKRDAAREGVLTGDRFEGLAGFSAASTDRQTSPSVIGTGQSADFNSDAFIRFSAPHMVLMSRNIDVRIGGSTSITLPFNDVYPTDSINASPANFPPATDATCEFYIDNIYAIQAKNGAHAPPGAVGAGSTAFQTTISSITSTPAGLSTISTMVGGTDVGARWTVPMSSGTVRGVTSITITHSGNASETTDNQFVRVYFVGTLVEDCRIP